LGDGYFVLVVVLVLEGNIFEDKDENEEDATIFTAVRG